MNNFLSFSNVIKSGISCNSKNLYNKYHTHEVEQSEYVQTDVFQLLFYSKEGQDSLNTVLTSLRSSFKISYFRCYYCCHLFMF